MTIKEQLFYACEAFIDRRLKHAKNVMQDIKESLTTETKSSAGDKHETGRAMLQLEREKTGKQIAEIEKTKALLSRIDIKTTSKAVHLGSLVYTSKLNYFVAISAGEIKIENTIFYAISPKTPIAETLFYKRVGDTIPFRNTIFTILKIE